MSYIGYTPWKKLKKLFYISTEIIQKFGFRYFFYVVKLELRKQGLSIFIPDSKPVAVFLEKDYDDHYSNYLKSLKQKLQIYDFQNDAEKKLTLCMVIPCFSFTSSELDSTIDSIKKQSYQNWNIVLCYSDPDVIPKNILSDKDFKIKLHNISNKNNFFQTNKGEYFAFINPGSKISDGTFSKISSKLNSEPETDMLYTDHDYIENNNRKNPFFKPDWNPYLFRSMNYLSPFCLIRKKILLEVMPNFDLNCFEFDLLLQSTEIAKKIVHLHYPLCSIPKKTITDSEIKCNLNSLNRHLKRTNIDAKTDLGILHNTYRIKYNLHSKPKVSIIIPTKNNYKILKRCIDSIEKKTNYPNKEIIIVDNASHHAKLKEYYSKLPYKILPYSDNFNFSKMNNLAVKESSGELLLFLNDDTKALQNDWLYELVSICMQQDVGAVGPKLVYSDGTIQHAGMNFLRTGAGFHPSTKMEKDSGGYHNLINVMKECLAVTGACLMTSRKVFDEIDGFDNQFDVYYGDSDLCLKIRDAGYRVVYTPYTELLHEGSRSISFLHGSNSFFDVENHQKFIKKWPFLLKKGDPFYHPDLSWGYSIAS